MDSLKKENINKTENFKLDKLDKLKVEFKNGDTVIFTDSVQKYLCINNDFENYIPFDSYTSPYMYSCSSSYYILKRGDLFALLYITKKDDLIFEVTDFIFSNKTEDNDLLVLYTENDEKYIYFKNVLFKNISEYEFYNQFLLVKYTDHHELYYYQHDSNDMKLEFSAKSIELCKILVRLVIDDLSDCDTLFKYKDKNGLYGYFIVNRRSEIIKKSSILYNSMEVFSCKYYAITKYVIMCTNKYNGKYLYNLKKPYDISECYDDIENVGYLFLCRKDAHIDIIDMNLYTYYSYDVNGCANVSLSYDEKDDKFILTENGTKIISLYIYDMYSNYSSYSIFTRDAKYGNYLCKKGNLLLTNFIRKINDVFEFKDSYLVYSDEIYASDIQICHDNFCFLFNKEENVNDIQTDLKYLKDILLFSENDYISLKKYIPLIKKCNITKIKGVTKENNSIIIEASTPICDILIKDDKIKVSVNTGEKFLISELEIKKSLTDYILENTTNIFHLAYLTYLKNLL